MCHQQRVLKCYTAFLQSCHECLRMMQGRSAPAELMWTIRGVWGSGRYARISPTVRRNGPAVNAGFSSPVRADISRSSHTTHRQCVHVFLIKYCAHSLHAFKRSAPSYSNLLSLQIMHACKISVCSGGYFVVKHISAGTPWQRSTYVAHISWML
jgi:hypothetical protein